MVSTRANPTPASSKGPSKHPSRTRPTAAAAPTAPPPAPPHQSPKSIINAWKSQTYITLDTGNHQHYSLSISDFLSIPHCTTSDEGWLREDAIDLALYLLTRDDGPSDVCVMKAWDALMLYKLTLGEMTAKEALDDPKDAAYRELKMALERKRWVVLPCSDGIMQAGFVGRMRREDGRKARGGSRAADEGGERLAGEKGNDGDVTTGGEEDNIASKEVVEEAPEKSTQETQKTDKSSGKAVYLGHGGHWGLLIIDHEKNTARWVDSLMALERVSKGKHKIAAMLSAGEAAGKVLCGYDALLGRKEPFRTSTLKYVPHQKKDNRTKEDGGACGPYMFAFLQYLYANPGYLEDLRHEFSFDRWSHHKRRINLDTGGTRQRMQEKIGYERQSQETAADFPFKLNALVMKILDVKIEPSQLLQFLDDFEEKTGGSRRGNEGADQGPSTQSNNNGAHSTSSTDKAESANQTNSRKSYQNALKVGSIPAGWSFDKFINMRRESEAVAQSLAAARQTAGPAPAGSKHGVAYPSEVNFTDMTAKELKKWDDTGSLRYYMEPRMDIWQRKAYYQQSFDNGFDHLTKEEAAKWKQHPDLDDNLGFDEIKTLLTTLVGTVPDYRGQWQHYPGYRGTKRKEVPGGGDASQPLTKNSKPNKLRR